MSNALTIAASGLSTQEYYLNTIAADLANLNTPNYKASKIIFEDIVYQNLTSDKTNLTNNSSLGCAIYKMSNDFSQGPLKASNNWNDIAIDGDGFFQAIDNEGNTIYTRNSTFTIDAENYLSTQDGLRLSDNIQVPENFIDISIQKNGEVYATLADTANPQELGIIQLTKFMNPETLVPIGHGLYKSIEESDTPLIDNPGSSGLGVLEQKQIEGSNVDMMRLLTQLTLTQKIYQLNAKALQIADEMEKMTNALRG